MMLQADQISWRSGSVRILNGVSLQVQPGEVLGILGPNGSGKSTLLKLLARIHRPTQGAVRLNGQDIWHLSPKTYAGQVAVMHQDEQAAFDGVVSDCVMLGRYPHQSRWRADSEHDKHVVTRSLARVEMAHKANARLSSLSGGERQRVLLARALAQEPQLLLLDEPTNHLDIRYQLALMRLVQTLQMTVVVVLHDLNLAAQHCTRLCFMRAGVLQVEGTTEQVLTSENIRHMYGVNALVDRHPVSGHLRVSYWNEHE